MDAGTFQKLWDSAQKALGESFKLPGFRDGQEAIVRAVLGGHDTLAVMPTGSGKSLCYQLPGLVMPGTTLVISPLIALMKDQVDSLRGKGIRAASLHSGMSPEEMSAAQDDVASGSIKFLFVAPERVRNPGFQAFLRRIRVGLLAVDEAHCISQWGHDFRPDYRRLQQIRDMLGTPVTIALTATASPEVQSDIVQQLGLRDPQIFILGFDRLNLRFGVRMFMTDAEKLEFAYAYVLQHIQQRRGFKRPYPGCGILYASTIKQAEKAASYLRDRGIRAGLYHANLSAEVRSRVQEQFMGDEFHCLVATTAFGMGVDKPDIRYVLHLSMSSSVEAYTQESGRAGRDRLPADCMMLYAPRDAKIQEHFIESGSPDLEIYRDIMDAFAEAARAKQPIPGTKIALGALMDRFNAKQVRQAETAIRKLRSIDMIATAPDQTATWLRDPPAGLARDLACETARQKKAAIKRLKGLIRYVYDEQCRTKFILSYFGSRDAKGFKRCHHCDLCGALPIRPEPGHDSGPFPPEPSHFIVLKYLSTVARCTMAKIPITPRQIASVLAGNAPEPMLHDISTYGLLDYLDPAEILVLAGAIRDAGLIHVPGGYTLLTQRGRQALAAKKLSDFPPTLEHYLSLRFSRAPGRGPAYQP